MSDMSHGMIEYKRMHLSALHQNLQSDFKFVSHFHLSCLLREFKINHEVAALTGNADSMCCNNPRSFTDLERNHLLFSLATPNHANDFLVIWDGSDKEVEIYIRNKMTFFKKVDYKQNTWHSVCTTWDSMSGLVQLWLDGQPSVKKFTSSGSHITGSPIITLGQVKFQLSFFFP
ncbi:hypothetical protein AMECASPLE_035715 [Ameca splendens]|uniref:Pentraxin family member n=1 Tax=Ameca splendens TaxID=208324 RepID=A0ABV1A4F3_9TELE